MVCRCSKRLLKDTFQTLSYDVTVGKLIEMGHLCKVGRHGGEP